MCYEMWEALFTSSFLDFLRKNGKSNSLRFQSWIEKKDDKARNEQSNEWESKTNSRTNNVRNNEDKDYFYPLFLLRKFKTSFCISS
ncbi:hypothetical protein PMALA_027810 [Plasmodium malariae]|uniref:Uncharacterized protein n=1 Tax=Plasmodium malariae TaxID=5858 RepID=A0A1A8WCZ9_PLAMA|nr:hypothetical protein PMALA_027810 [Plasmodium malariae]